METKEQYLQMKKAWSEASNLPKEEKFLELAHYCIYAELRGRDFKTCLAPTTKRETLSWLSPHWVKGFFSEWASEDTLSAICEKINNEKWSI